MKAEAATGNSDGAPVEEGWAIKKNRPIDK
jgi:hypothetical protein